MRVHCTLRQAPDGFLHFIGHDHGKCGATKYAHFISRNQSLAHWQEAAGFGGPGSGSFMEPNPIPVAGDGVFGNQIRPEWVDFGAPSVAIGGLHFSHVSWHWTNGTTPTASP